MSVVQVRGWFRKPGAEIRIPHSGLHPAVKDGTDEAIGLDEGGIGVAQFRR